MNGHVVSEKLRKSVKGMECTINFMGICNHDSEKTVLCHVHDDFKGMGNKASDLSAFVGCFACHQYFDVEHRRKPQMPDELLFRYVLRAIQKTHAEWVARGLIIVPQDIKKSKKTKPRKPKSDRAKIQSQGFQKGLKRKFDGTIERI